MKTFLYNALEWVIGKLWNPAQMILIFCWKVKRLFRNRRFDSPDFDKPQSRQVKEWTLGRLRLIRWGMWDKLPLWDVRVSIKQRFIMSGPYELRIDR